MKRLYSFMGVVCGFVLLLLFTGCSTVPPYQVGDVERIQFSYEESHWQWMEMPDMPPKEKDGRLTKKDIVIRREIESIDDKDQSIRMKVTLETVDISMKTVLKEKERLSYYRSSEEKTESSFSNALKLAGASYIIRIAPDTTVLEIIDLDELKEKLKIQDEKFSPAQWVLTPEFIRQLHERECLQSGVKPGKTLEKLTVVPHELIKAKAIHTTYTADRGRKEADARWVTVTSTGQPVHSLPEGWDEPPDPTDGRIFIKNMYDMQKLDVTGKGVLDANSGRVKSEQKHIFCSLVYLGSKFAAQNPQYRQKDGKDAGELFAKITVDQTVEVIP